MVAAAAYAASRPGGPCAQLVVEPRQHLVGRGAALELSELVEQPVLLVLHVAFHLADQVAVQALERDVARADEGGVAGRFRWFRWFRCFGLRRLALPVGGGAGDDRLAGVRCRFGPVLLPRSEPGEEGIDVSSVLVVPSTLVDQRRLALQHRGIDCGVGLGSRDLGARDRLEHRRVDGRVGVDDLERRRLVRLPRGVGRRRGGLGPAQCIGRLDQCSLHGPVRLEQPLTTGAELVDLGLEQAATT
jgi:hypothetical protein